MSHEHLGGKGPGRLGAFSTIAFLGFVGVAGYFLVTEHRAHFFGILPFLLLAACPLLHLFHHRGHGGGADAAKDAGGDSADGRHRH